MGTRTSAVLVPGSTALFLSKIHDDCLLQLFAPSSDTWIVQGRSKRSKGSGWFGGIFGSGRNLGKGWCNWMNPNFQHVSSYGLNPQNMWNPKKGVAVLDNPDRFELFHIPMQLEKNQLPDDKRPIQWPADFWRSSGESLFPTESLRTCRACGSSVFVHPES